MEDREQTALDIAVVGMSCRFPGAPTLDAYWRLVAEGREGISRLSREEMRAAGADDDRLGHPDLVPAAGIVPDGEDFDATFFGYSAREAALIDPQQRMFLQAAWHALEDAGHAPDTFPGRVGVYAGQTMGTYHRVDLGAFLGTSSDLLMSANDKDFLPTRVSYKLGLTGPSIAVQTACSTSLVAIHLACQALLTFDCDMALAGGVSWTPLRRMGYLRRDNGIWSVDGHVRPFDEAGTGFVPADGLGVVVLRRMADALASGDRIYAVVRGGAVTNDGAARLSYVAPGVLGQAAAVRDALTAANVAPDTVGYVEAHGTATAVGDVVEVTALTEAYRAAGATGVGFCGLGSVKANIGHTDAAAGVAGFIKAALMLHHRYLPPSPHFRRPNPEIDFASSPFQPRVDGGPWPSAAHPRRVAVSSFGIGGTNAHVILEEAPPRPPSGPSRPWQLVTLSARDVEALQADAEECGRFLRDREADLADVAYTLAVGRRQFGRRLAGVFPDRETAVRSLCAPSVDDARLVVGDAHLGPPDDLVFMFPGGGAQYRDMGRGLYQHYPVYREAVDECLGLLADPVLADPVLADLVRAALFFDHPLAAELGAAAIEDPTSALPALFVTEVALGRLLTALGLRPTVFLGHSLGEYAAAHFAGVFTLRDALAVVVERGRILAALSDGAMLSVAAAEHEIRPFLTGTLSLCAVNGPALCVVAGPADQIRTLRRQLTAQGVSCQALPLTTAAHSELVESGLPEFRRFLSGIPLRPPTAPLVSNVYGRVVGDEVADPEYWVTHLRTTVRFAEGLEHVLARGRAALVEVGPGTTLATLARAALGGAPDVLVVSATRHPQERRDDVEVLLDAVGRLWVSGVDVDVSALYRDERRARVPSVRYSFAPTPCRLDRSGSPSAPARPRPRPTRPRDWLYAVDWRRSVDLTRPDLHAVARGGGWLVLSDHSPLADRVVAVLRRHGAEPVVATPGTDFRRTGATDVELPPEETGHYPVLFSLVGDQDRPLRIVDLWSRPERAEFGPDLASVIGVARGAAGGTRPVELCVVTRGAFSVTGGERLSPRAACAVGASRVLPHEISALSVTVVDLDPGEVDAAGTPDQDQLARDLLSEFARPQAEEPVALRGGRRWVRRFLSLADHELPPAPLRPRGVYVVTGGLGGVGLRVAEHLATTRHARVVLIGRHAGPEDLDVGTARGDGVRRLLALGADVTVHAADVADRTRIKDVLSEVLERFGAVHGVVHAAGVAGGGMAQLLGHADVAEALRAKVDGTVVLLDALREVGARPDFVVLFSSLASFVGAPGLACYGAANAFLDTAAVQASRELGVPTLSINWDRWRGTGMAVDVERHHRRLSGAELGGGMCQDDAVAAFEAALAALPLGQVAVSVVPPEDLVAASRVSEDGRHAPASPAVQAALPEGWPGDDAGSPPDLAPRSRLERDLLGVWEQVLGVAGIGPHDDFFALGGHSLLALQVVQRCEEELGVAITVRDLFAAPTVGALARAIDGTAEPGGSPWEPEVPEVHDGGARPPVTREWWPGDGVAPGQGGR
ncbi:type I polyketide synthase [Streptoalloteichus tenebrarius]|uniref:type I polyketide synthase n=1 Tax=Streptoalloteichus tenebrarius (strain ATCC 17920 / DSM 40477 / JCM 4838 / CBS 697.72 / NBRC 16177 / NCIMB 11028 / NRRL B-12390 / A12253. 1 / ISP 5477) TaxID=1933 RepID=UPI0020A5B520|nr:type I polyketide synthase [Streptoalloteichus tenebrarius]